MNPDQIESDDSYRFYLYFFDEIGGHTPLFSFSKNPDEDKNERKILSIHPVWWHQEKFLESSKFLTLDLEMEGVVYSATLFFCKSKRKKKRFGMDSSKWEKERFVLFVRSPSSVSFIAQEILYELKTRIQGNIGEKLCYLVENYFSTDEKSDVREFFAQQSKSIEQQLTNICQDLIPKAPIAKLEASLADEQQQPISQSSAVQAKEETKTKKLRFSIPKPKKVGKTIPKKKKIIESMPKRIKIIKIEQNPLNKYLQVTMCNKDSQTFTDVTITVIQSEEFFKKDVFQISVEKWIPGENVFIEFELIADLRKIYFLRIEDEHEVLRIKRIIG
ncbi:MAG: hypothetical protein ACW964_00635 [Candidatus Hodarchaeales archaeon]|jgi:hypothetical protein